MRTLLTLALSLATLLPASAGWPHRMIAADYHTKRLAMIEPDGSIAWEFPNRHDVHDIQLLENGNVLTHTGPTRVVEITPEKTIAWQYESKPTPENKSGRVEVHAFQRLADGLTMIAESGNARIIEVDAAGEIQKVVPLNVGKPDPHRDTRRVRKLDSGNYLVCHEALGVVREYDPAGKTAWEYALDLGGRPASPGHGVTGHGTAVFSAIRLANGNTLIGGGNNNRVLEVSPEKEIVWQLTSDDLPGIQLAWITGVQVLSNGNLIVGNCHAGPENPQLIEVTRAKKVVATYRDFKTFGDALVSSVVIEPRQ